KTEPLHNEGGKESSFVDDYTTNLNFNGKLGDRKTGVIYPSTSSIEKTPDLKIRHELLDRIHAFIPPGATSSQDGVDTNSRHLEYSGNPMTDFKFDVEKI
ncbi:4478_t:CDS:1, partial [Acaulospora colombiana]